MNNSFNKKIAVSIALVFIFSLFLTPAMTVRSFAGGIEELNKSVNKLEISTENQQGATDNQSQAAAGEGVQASADGQAGGGQAMTPTSESVASGMESIKNGFKSIFEGFKDIFKGIFDLFKQLVNEFKKLFSSVEGEVKKAGEEIGRDAQQIGNQLEQGVQGAADAVGRAGEAISGAADQAVNEVSDAVNRAADEVGGAANQAADALNNAVTEGANAVEGAASNGAGTLTGGTQTPAGGDAVPPASTEAQQPDAAAPAAEGTQASPAAAQSGTVIDEDPNGLNVRTGPWGDIVGTLQKGTKIDIIGKEGDWYKIKYGGGEAFVYAGLVSADGEAGNNASNETESATAGENSQPAAANPDAAATPDTGATASNNETTGGTRVPPAEQKAADASTPYFNQYDNAFFSASTCQNTSLAMVLAKYGWKGDPDQVTKTFGKDMAQTPAGLEHVFNSLASDAGLDVRIKSHTNGTMELINKLLAEGKPVIAHGWFTPSGHVVTITGFDGQNYTVNDPAGEWNGQFKGGYTGGSGKGVKYSKEALTEALVENGEVWCHEVITGDKVAGL